MTTKLRTARLRSMPILTEPIGSIPRPDSLVQTILNFQAGKTTAEEMEGAYSEALRDTIERLEQTGSPVITDGEQTKSSFATYPLSGLTNLAPDGVIIPFADGHTRQLPRLTAEPFRYGAHAAIFVKRSEEHTSELQSLRHLVCRLLLEKKEASGPDCIAPTTKSADGVMETYAAAA